MLMRHMFCATLDPAEFIDMLTSALVYTKGALTLTLTLMITMAHELYYATTNAGKFDEIKRFLHDHNSAIILKQFDYDLVEIQTSDQQAIALHKAAQAWDILHKPVLVEDCGIYFEKYNQFPGTASKWLYEGIGLENILKLVNEGDKAYFLMTLVYSYGPGYYKIFEGRCDGYITHPAQFSIPPGLPYPYAAIFAPDGLKQTLADIRFTPKEHEYNYRIHALKKFLSWYTSQYTLDQARECAA
jgi:XTP/dITP diphosphohydrolase